MTGKPRLPLFWIGIEHLLNNTLFGPIFAIISFGAVVATSIVLTGLLVRALGLSEGASTWAIIVILSGVCCAFHIALHRCDAWLYRMRAHANRALAEETRRARPSASRNPKETP